MQNEPFIPLMSIANDVLAYVVLIIFLFELFRDFIWQYYCLNICVQVLSITEIPPKKLSRYPPDILHTVQRGSGPVNITDQQTNTDADRLSGRRHCTTILTSSPWDFVSDGYRFVHELVHRALV